MNNKKINTPLVGALQKSTTKDDVSNCFRLFDVTEYKDKIDYLNIAMYSPQTFFSSGTEISLEQKYELTLQMFLAGTWKLYTYYEKLGLGKQYVQA